MFNLSELSGIHSKIANDVHKDGMKLRCYKCKREQAVTKEQFAQYLSSGWPDCCNETMELITKD